MLINIDNLEYLLQDKINNLSKILKDLKRSEHSLEIEQMITEFISLIKDIQKTFKCYDCEPLLSIELQELLCYSKLVSFEHYDLIKKTYVIKQILIEYLL